MPPLPPPHTEGVSASAIPPAPGPQQVKTVENTGWKPCHGADVVGASELVRFFHLIFLSLPGRPGFKRKRYLTMAVRLCMTLRRVTDRDGMSNVGGFAHARAHRTIPTLTEPSIRQGVRRCDRSFHRFRSSIKLKHPHLNQPPAAQSTTRHSINHPPLNQPPDTC